MSAKDAKAKKFLSNNQRFADLFNYYLFDGKEIIRPEDLEERDTTEILSIYGYDGKETQKQKWRDLLKSAIIKSSDHAIFVLLGIENQSDIHYAMPVRNLIYDAMNYGAQIAEATVRHKENKDYASNAEFLSGFRKEDKLTPVITVTVYWGAEKWDAPRSLHEMFDASNQEILKFIDDYHLHLIIPQEIENFQKFKTSIGEVLEIIKVSKDKAAMKAVLTKNPTFRHIEAEAVSTINVFTGFHIPVTDRKERYIDMSNAWEEQKLEGIEVGIKALIFDNLEEGKTEEIIVNKLVKRFDLQLEAAKKYFDKFAKELV